MIKSLEKLKAHWLLLSLICIVSIVLVLHGRAVAQLSEGELTQINHRVMQLEQTNKRQIDQLNKLQAVTGGEFVKVTSQLHGLQVEVTKFGEQANEQEQKVSTVEGSVQSLAAALNQLQTQIKQLAKQAKHRIQPNYLPASLLPFRVLGVDIWNGIGKVTVQLHNELNLMAVNDRLAGWTLTNVSTEPAVAIFKSRQGQLVKVVF